MTETGTLKPLWREKTEPPALGEYFVAVRYPHGFGSYDVASWNGSQWQLGYNADIVGWIPLDEILGGLNAGWPSDDEENFGKPFREQFEEHRKKNPLSDSSEDDFVELKD
ncbi:hypothetical protein [Hahella ganghwensis]|uniref:hypothetical protein n=1 Tax=Hahella ganghwensis TaxID=286420 RepID=UPI00035FCE91|nr:hypothetical protein [Hahella ganghwensis]